MTAPTLTEFLLARIAEDEEIAGDPKYDQPPNDMSIEWAEVGGMSEVLIIGEARLRAECQTKRRIVEESVEGLRLDVSCGEGHAEGFTVILASLALPYAAHPDYREEWKP